MSNSKDNLKGNERVDLTGFGDLKLIQNPEEFCYGVDAVILTDFASKILNSKKPPARIIDLGTGTGIIPLILSYKLNGTEGLRVTGIDVQENSVDRAIRMCKLNGLENTLDFMTEDVKDFASRHENLKGAFDVVITNPPYVERGSGMKSDNVPKMIARHETTATLSDFICTAAELLKDRGDLFMVHRPQRLVDIFCEARRFKLEPKFVRMAHPKAGEPANIALIHMVKNGRPELIMLPPLAIHGEDGEFTEELEEAYL